MAVSPQTTASVSTVSALPGQRRSDEAGRSRLAAGSARAPQVGPSKTPGELVGRPDLSDAVVLKSIAERMTFEGRDGAKAQAVLNAALAGRPVACAFLRRLVLPPPQSALQMPIQTILRESPSTGEAKSSWRSRLSFGR